MTSTQPTPHLGAAGLQGPIGSPQPRRPWRPAAPGGGASSPGLRAVAAAVLACGALGSAQASTAVFNFDPGSNWRTTTDHLVGQQWALGNYDPSQGIGVQTGYGNVATSSLPTDSMMWNCGVDGDQCGAMSGSEGPLEAFFGYGFHIDEGSQVLSAVLRVIADDFFHLRINGVSVVAAMLDDHMVGGQPNPLNIDISSYLKTGDNVLTLRAMDGALKGSAASCEQGVEVNSVLGAFCRYDRGYEFVSVGGAAVVSVPTPGSLWLLGSSLGLLAWFSRARPGSARGGRSLA